RMTYEMVYPTYSDSTYVDWDFENTWIVGWPTKYENYPLLKWQTFTSIEHDDFTPEKCKLYQNYPNPFNPNTEIRFSIPKASLVDLSVYNVNGQKVAELINGKLDSGKHSVQFDGSGFNSGIYYYSINADGYSLTRKMIMLK
ncbi:MAG: T9SS type A sorting domain-containing protein, partial [Candidatus Delongbacteria bacterium]